MNNLDNKLLDFVYTSDVTPKIKVIGVGGGGGNAVNNMYRRGIHNVSFALCNTDRQALSKSEIPYRIQMGEGLGAGNKPERARTAAEESLLDIHEMLNDGTKMVFITAGMGGGTGTGAAPVIAREAKGMDILTVGIVTIPFVFEGQKKINQALDGVDELSKNVDALLVINNQRLSDIYPELSFFNAFEKADDTLTTAAKGIAEIITVDGYINLDFADVQTTLKDGGMAIMSTGMGSGVNRVTKAIEDALKSPLLKNSDFYSAQKVLFNLYFAKETDNCVTMEEMSEIDEFMSRCDGNVDVIWGASVDDSLGDDVKITLLATGFGVSDLPVASTFRQQKAKAAAEAGGIVSDEVNEDEEEKRRTEFILKTYGTDITTTQAKPYYIFNLEDLDNDALIEKVEQNPAYNRDKAFGRNLQAQFKSSKPDEPVNNNNANMPNQSSTVISF